tara:strand:+ start:639 stop:1211 length:573 start_codon:yes stop_codon:yes gene_type:complete
MDNNSQIIDFELLQENPKSENSIRITSPKAIINPNTNDISIFDSSIEIFSKNGGDILVKSGESSFYNSQSLIEVYNKVFITLLDEDNHFIRTSSLNWDLDTSSISLDSPLDINFDNTNISSSNGLYNINLGILTIYNNNLKRNIINMNSRENYEVKIISDFARWTKESNLLEFISNNKQVETTINFLTIK